MQNTPITVIEPKAITEPKAVQEYFARLQARYRSNAVHTPQEWPMNTPRGRSAYWNSRSREQFVESHNVDDLKNVLARAMERLSSLPNGQKVDMNALLYGQVQ